MDISFTCILIAAVLPYILTGVAKFAGKGYDNASPRDYLSKQEGVVKRANYAHLNAFEAFPAFAAAVIMAHIAGISHGAINILSILFIICRVFHGIFYIMNRPSLRSLVWVLGFICVITLMLISLRRWY